MVRKSLIKSFTKRIVFRLDNEEQSKLLLGQEGAEKLGEDKIYLYEPLREKPKKIKLIG